MVWNLDFITEDDFKNHVINTISHYGEKLKPYDLNKFNSNIVDPVKLIFDKSIYRKDWESIIAAEIFRQRDKSNTNEIGYFHQRLFQFISGCHVPANGQEGGWDIVVEIPAGHILDNGDVVHKIYVEMKNKHNTMNSAAAAKTYIKMQSQLLADDDCACFLVEVIAKKSQNVAWKTTVDKNKVSHARIRRISIDKFYEIVTNKPDAFYQICMTLPEVIEEVISTESQELRIPIDSVYEELSKYAQDLSDVKQSKSLLLSLYLLGFRSYNGFNTLQAR